MAYLPIAFFRQRLNGQDFIGVSVCILDYLREQPNVNEDDIEIAAHTMVHSFNDMLNPKMSENELDDLVQMLVNNGPLTRMMAKQNQAENDSYIEKIKENLNQLKGH